MKRAVLLIFTIVFWTRLVAQLYPFVDDHLTNPLLLNNALVAKQSYLNVNLSVFRLFALSNSPSHLTLTVSKRYFKMGGSFQILSHITGPWQSLAIGGSYFYQIKVNYRTKAAFSLSSYLQMEGLRLNSLQMEPGDPVVNSYRFLIYPQFSFSTILYQPQWTLGFSATNLVPHRSVQYYPQTFILFWTYFYRHPIELYYFKPQVIAWFNKNYFGLEPVAVIYLKKILKLGLSSNLNFYYNYGFRPRMSFILGLSISNRFYFTYVWQYDFASANVFIARWHNYLSLSFKFIQHRGEVPRFF